MADKVTESPMHRFRKGDTVEMLHNDYEGLDVAPDKEGNVPQGKVKGFANDEGTYLTIDFDGKEHVLTEDELRRV